jgi:glycosyltransferase involved in cell wall biosynthesis
MKETENISILVIPSWYPPRGGEFFREHSIALAQAGLKVHVLAGIETGIRKHTSDFFLQKGTHTNHLNDITETRRFLRRIPMLEQANARRWVNIMVKMFADYAAHHPLPDLVQTHSSMWAGLAAARIKQRWGTPYVITEHRGRFTGEGQMAQKLIKDWHKPLLAEAFDEAKHIVSVSASLHDKIKEISPQSSNKLSVIPNMTDTDFFVPAGHKSSQDKIFRFLCVTHLEHLKGIDVLLHAFAGLQTSKAQASRLVIAGSGVERARLETLCDSLGLKDKVVFTDRLSRKEVLKQMQDADALVLPSRFEAFGVVLIEAMACGLPVIATNSGGPGDIVKHDTGMMCKPGNADDLMGAMQQMINHHHDYDRQKIRLHCLERYSREAVSAQYVKLYQSMRA